MRKTLYNVFKFHSIHSYIYIYLAFKKAVILYESWATEVHKHVDTSH